MRGTAASRSAEASTRSGATPPCSRAHRTPGASFDRRRHPTAALPMKEKNAVRSLVTSCSATCPGLGSARHHSGGRPASRRMSTKARQDSGVADAGLTTTGQPVATAGADLVHDEVERVVEGADRHDHADGLPGGERPAGRPRRASRPSGSRSRAGAGPPRRRARTPSMARSVSTRASVRGLPPSQAMRRASSSRRSRMIAAARRSTAMRSCTGSRAPGSRARAVQGGEDVLGVVGAGQLDLAERRSRRTGRSPRAIALAEPRAVGMEGVAFGHRTVLSGPGPPPRRSVSLRFSE
jgi:hypothetical protein